MYYLRVTPSARPFTVPGKSDPIGIRNSLGRERACFCTDTEGHMRCSTTKLTKWHVRPAKTQISLSSAQSDQSSLCAQ